MTTIKQGKIAEVLDLLVEQGREGAVVLRARYNQAKKQNEMGMIDYREWERVVEQVGNAALQMAALEPARTLVETEARITELEKMRQRAIGTARAVLETTDLCRSDWVGLLETLECDEADYHTYAEGV